MKIIAYARVSTASQEADNQVFELNTYANSQNITFDATYSEVISSKKKIGARLISKVIDSMESGDLLVVTEISRIGRSLYEVMGLLGQMLEAGLQVYAVKQKWHLGNSMISKVQAMGFTLSADLERDLISQRTKDGLARAKANGKILGRPVGSLSPFGRKLSNKEDDIALFLSEGLSCKEIGQRLNVCACTVRTHIKEFGIGSGQPRIGLSAPADTKPSKQNLRVITETTGPAPSDNQGLFFADSLKITFAKNVKFWAYIRVSCDKQTNENQVLQISKTMSSYGIDIWQWCEEVISSRIKLELRAVWQFINQIPAGDTLVISEISRLGRSQGEIIRIFEALLAKKVSIYSIRDNFMFADNIESKTIIGCMGIAVQIERAMISQRTIEALKAKRAAGVVFGRPKGRATTRPKPAEVLQEEGRRKELILKAAESWQSENDLAKELGISNSHTRKVCIELLGVTYPQLCEQKTGFKLRTQAILFQKKAYILKAAEDGITKQIVCKKLKCGCYTLDKFTNSEFGCLYGDLKAKTSNTMDKIRYKSKAAKAAQKYHSKELMTLALEFAKPTEIAKKWNCATSTIQAWARKHGLK